MGKRRLAMQLECLGLPFRQAVPTAARLGCSGIVLRAEGHFAPQQLTQTGRRELQHRVASEYLHWAALVCPLNQGLDEAVGLEERLNHIRLVMQLAFDLGPRAVILAAGAIPEALDDPKRTLLASVLTDLGRWGDRMGTRLLLEAGLEPPAHLAAFLASLDTGSLGISLDPAHLLMHQHDVLGALRDAHALLGHFYLRDAQPRRLDRFEAEVALGAGDVNWLQIMGTLEEIGYNGWLTLKRHSLKNPVAEMMASIQFYHQISGPSPSTN